eukprot:GHVR01193005.1.p1 GENE.GHVR01193005.1~~GHVR01193005.1.p1  ORF type:complete len:103 (+),score=2.87 GHVR01193005.1:236-544(+)
MLVVSSVAGETCLVCTRDLFFGFSQQPLQLQAPLDNSHNVKLVAAQVICSQHSMVTFKYSNYIRCFQIALCASLKENWLLNTNVTPEDVSGFLNYNLGKHTT